MATPTNNLEVFEEFGKIDNKYKTGGTSFLTNMPNSVDFQILEEISQTLAEIETAAEDALSDYLLSNTATINLSYDNSKFLLDLQISKLNQTLEINKAEIDTKYLELKNNAQDAAIKNGIASSSAIVTLLYNIQQEGEQKKAVLTSKNDVAVLALNQKLEQILVVKNTKLENLQNLYASKKAAKVLELKNLEHKRITDALKYNNDNALKNANFSLNYGKAAFDETSDTLKRRLELFEFEFDYGVSGLNKVINEEKYAVATSYLNTLDPTTALYYVVNEEFYAAHLDASYLEKLKALYYAAG